MAEGAPPRSGPRSCHHRDGGASSARFSASERPTSRHRREYGQRRRPPLTIARRADNSRSRPVARAAVRRSVRPGQVGAIAGLAIASTAVRATSRSGGERWRRASSPRRRPRRRPASAVRCTRAWQAAHVIPETGMRIVRSPATEDAAAAPAGVGSGSSITFSARAIETRHSRRRRRAASTCRT